MNDNISIFDVEQKGVKAHWKFNGFSHQCSMCDYNEWGISTSKNCPNCKAVMIMPAPINRCNYIKGVQYVR